MTSKSKIRIYINITILFLVIVIIAVSCSPNTLEDTIYKTNLLNNEAIIYSSITGTVDIPLLVRPTNGIVSDAPLHYSITPKNLPQGLLFNTSNGSIIGTPELIREETRYIVTVSAMNNYEDRVKSNTFTISINQNTKENQNDNSITTISNNSTIRYTDTQGIIGRYFLLKPITSIVLANAIVEYTINPEVLPDGLTFHTDSGIINGTPNTVFSLASYTVTATAKNNIVGTATSNIFTISVGHQLTGNLLYEKDINVQIGTRLNLIPTHSFPIDARVSYAITPNEGPNCQINCIFPTDGDVSGPLPSELVFSTDTGLISGTANTAINIFLQVTATASGEYTGTVESNVINIIVPRQSIGGSLRYPNIIEGVLDTYLRVLPIGYPNILTTYQISEHSHLPTGLSVNSITGAIEGTPEVTSAGTIDRQVKIVGTGSYTGEIYSNEFKIKIYAIRKIELTGEFNYLSEWPHLGRFIPYEWPHYRQRIGQSVDDSSNSLSFSDGETRIITPTYSANPDNLRSAIRSNSVVFSIVGYRNNVRSSLPAFGPDSPYEASIYRNTCILFCTLFPDESTGDPPFEHLELNTKTGSIFVKDDAEIEEFECTSGDARSLYVHGLANGNKRCNEGGGIEFEYFLVTATAIENSPYKGTISRKIAILKSTGSFSSSVLQVGTILDPNRCYPSFMDCTE